jgi:hypothetical protein
MPDVPAARAMGHALSPLPVAFAAVGPDLVHHRAARRAHRYPGAAPHLHVGGAGSRTRQGVGDGGPAAPLVFTPEP